MWGGAAGGRHEGGAVRGSAAALQGAAGAVAGLCVLAGWLAAVASSPAWAPSSGLTSGVLPMMAVASAWMPWLGAAATASPLAAAAAAAPRRRRATAACCRGTSRRVWLLPCSLAAATAGCRRVEAPRGAAFSQHWAAIAVGVPVPATPAILAAMAEQKEPRHPLGESRGWDWGEDASTQEHASVPGLSNEESCAPIAEQA